jgi:hypothetical protein
MRRPDRSINIFSISMLDVISGALGAFLIVMVILMPYYNRESIDYQREIQELQEQKAAAEQEAEAAEQRASAAEQAASEAEQRAEAAESLLNRTFLLVLISWSSIDDVDLYLRDPGGALFFYGNPRIDGRPGELSEDVERGPGNEVWQVETAETGEYHVCAHLFRSRTRRPVQVRGNVYHLNGRSPMQTVTLSLGDQVKPMAIVSVDQDGNVTLRPGSQDTCPTFTPVDRELKP